MLLICPPKNWQTPLPIEESALPLLQELAQRLGLAYNYQPTQGKVYFGPAEEVDAAEPALSEPTPEATPEEVAAMRNSEFVIGGVGGGGGYDSNFGFGRT